MKIVKISIENFKGIKDKVEITTNDFNCIVGKNDVGKSTILKALDIFLNDKSPSKEDKNMYVDSTSIMIELTFEINPFLSITIDGAIPTTFIEEELLNERAQLVIKKVWNVANDRPRLEWFIKRKSYTDNDFLFLTEANLIKLCKNLGIETVKGNNQEYNNVEKRRKLREFYQANYLEYNYEYTLLGTTATTRQKIVLDVIKYLLPSFEYFKADTSLSESDNSIQKYFREKALNVLKGEVDTIKLQETIKHKIQESLSKITTLINSIVLDEEHVTANVEFDWSKLISTTFKSEKDSANIPLASRGDGFRRITMMSYFEMLAEETKEDKNIIFGFEEPETFLHPQVQKQLFQKLKNMVEVGYQIFSTTHSPIIVSETDINSIIYIKKNDNEYMVLQSNGINIREIIEDLGIKADDEFIRIYNNIKLFFLVEGPDDIEAFEHLAKLYKANGKISKTFYELNIHLLPLGGKDSIKHWVNLDILNKLGRPFYVVIDSDRMNVEEINSRNAIRLIQDYKLKENIDFQVLRKREIENYIPYNYFTNIGISFTFDDYDYEDIKKKYSDAGGRKNAISHFTKLSYDELLTSMSSNGNDEFLEIYNAVCNKIDLISN